MHTGNVIRLVVLTTGLAASAVAGPTMACTDWVSTPGSVFATLDPLRQMATGAYSPGRKEESLAKLAHLRSAVKPDDPVSLLKAGYWTEVMNLIGVSHDTDGPELILRALELRPNDAEYEFMAALAYADAFGDADKANFRKHWNRARELAKPGTAVAKNLELLGGLLSKRPNK